MSEFPEIEKLIRLKRYERPSCEFVDEFVQKFQERQRAELLRRSARSLLWERVTTYLDEVMSPRWGWAVASAVGMAALVVWVKPASHPAENFAANQPAASPDTLVVSGVDSLQYPAPAFDERVLLARHYDGGFIDTPHGTILPAVGMPLGDDARFLPR